MTHYQFLNNKYTDWYSQIINNAQTQTRSKKDSYYEAHHIQPKSLGGSNKKHNLVLLTAREHYICHLLLVKMVSRADVYRMVGALARFADYKNNRNYETIRKTISNNSKGDLNKSFGKIWGHHPVTKQIKLVTQEELQAQGLIKGIGRQRGGHNNTQWINDGYNEILVSRTELDLYPNWHKGRITERSKEHMVRMNANRHTPEKDQEHSQKLSGRLAIKHPMNNTVKRIPSEELTKWLAQGWVLGEVTTAISKKCSIEGIHYPSIAQAARAHNIHVEVLRYRLKSVNWPTWVIVI